MNTAVQVVSCAGLLLRIAVGLLLLSSATGAEGARAAIEQGAVVIHLEPYLRAQAVVHAVVAGQSGTFLFDTGEGVSSFSPEFAHNIGCKPWGQITGFRMSGERVDSQHCDNITFELDGVSLQAPVVGILDIMKFMGPDVPHVDGALGLDLFAGQIITITPRKSIILETPASLARRIAHARKLPIRIVRDVEGIALAVDGAVQTPDGLAWMELDSGNGGSLVVADHIARFLGLKSGMETAEEAQFILANGIVVKGPTRTRDLIMDGNIGAQFLNNYVLTLDLKHPRAWLSPMPAEGADSAH
jgi:Aspartyl protease